MKVTLNRKNSTCRSVEVHAGDEITNPASLTEMIEMLRLARCWLERKGAEPEKK